MKKFIPIFLIVTFVIFFFSNCEKEDIDFNNSEININNGIKVEYLQLKDIKSNINLIDKLEKIESIKSQFSSIKKSHQIDFDIIMDGIRYIENGDHHSYTFPIQRHNKSNNNIENLVLKLNGKGEYDAFIVDYDFTAKELKNFTEEDISSRQVSLNPLDLNFNNFIDDIKKSTTICIEEWNLIGIYSPRTFEISHYIWVLVSVTCTTVGGGGGGGTGTGTDGSSGGSTTDPNNNDDPFSDGGSGGGSTGGTSGGTNSNDNPSNIDDLLTSPTPTPEEFFDDEIFIENEFKNNPCLMSVYEGMGKASTFSSYLEKFDDDFSVAHLRYSASSSLPNGVNAQTSAPENYNIVTTFNLNELDRPALSIARTFIHEIIHAEIFRKLLSVAQSPNIELTYNQILQLKNDFPGLYDYYERYKWETDNPGDAQHEAMAQHYRSIIELALREFDNSQDDEVYEALSWVGLMGTGPINPATGLTQNPTVAWSNLSATDRLNIISTIQNFNSSNNNCQ